MPSLYTGRFIRRTYHVLLLIYSTFTASSGSNCVCRGFRNHIPKNIPKSNHQTGSVGFGPLGPLKSIWVFFPNIHSYPFYILFFHFVGWPLNPTKGPPAVQPVTPRNWNWRFGGSNFRRKATLRQVWLKGCEGKICGRFWANYIAKCLWFRETWNPPAKKCPNTAGLGIILQFWMITFTWMLTL